MSFFDEQERAKKASLRLGVMFAMAVLAVIALINVGIDWGFKQALVSGYLGGHPPMSNQAEWARWMMRAHPELGRMKLFAHTASTGLAMLAIVGAALWNLWELSRMGGERVARMAGARPAKPDPNFLEKRFINVVHEMALAAGATAPSCWVMDEEDSINAFAAGWSQEDAVICVTRGALERLNREELQGVVGHEMSHIINADMRVSMNGVALIAGLMALSMLGWWMIRLVMETGAARSSSRDDKKGGPIVMAALGLGAMFLALGFLGAIAGKIIAAAISREREWLADASSVQFTRNPDGIGGALRKIAGLAKESGGAGSELRAPQAAGFSHMLLGAGAVKWASGLLATHPPIEQRIARVYGGRAQKPLAPRRSEQDDVQQS